MEVRHLNPQKYMVLSGGVVVAGVKTITVSRPNDMASVENDLNGDPTFIENPQGSIFEVTLDMASEASGNKILHVPAVAKTLVPFAIVNAETQIPFLATEKARIMYTGSGMEDSGSDTPVNFKVIGASEKVIFS